ncbi:hypothetical protein AB0M00_19470 [Streptomyces chartreusis]|uniref:hypothetical protein n=1 Tax=Streptomyces chartreusis TaxID=1969 RepID=UPI0034451AAE
MAERRLKTYVHVGGELYGPSSEVPPEVAEQIGDHAWDDGTDETGDEPARVGFDDPSTQRAQGSASEAPPRTGRGSGVEAWRQYAAQNDLDVPADASREDVIAAAEGAGLIEPEQPKE